MMVGPSAPPMTMSLLPLVSLVLVGSDRLDEALELVQRIHHVVAHVPVVGVLDEVLLLSAVAFLSGVGEFFGLKLFWVGANGLF